jgi:hypothetical protein
MHHKTMTISVPAPIADKAQRAVDADLAESVSAYFTRLAERDPDWASVQAEDGAQYTANRNLFRSDEEWMRSLNPGSAERSEAPLSW